ncbi:MAG: hypothetical protein HY689_12980 [Chloroflexi bacterium]|nr:hypothetical protein [Chloroflexota bacterium]
MEFRPRVWPGVVVGGGIVALLAGLAVLLARRMLEQPVSLVSFVVGLVVLGLLLGAALFLYWTAGCASLRYHLDRNRLAIRWGFSSYLVPLSAVVATLPGTQGGKRRAFRGVSWPGHHVGRALVDDLGEVVFLSTHLWSGELRYIVTSSLAYAISVPNPQRFLRELHRCQTLGPSEAVAPSAQRPAWLDLPLWHDRIVHGLLALGLVANAALFAYLCYAFPSLPELLPLRFTAEGVVEQIGLRSYVLMLPAVSLAVLVVNAVLGAILYARERIGTYLCLGAAVLVQGLVGVAIVRIAG